MCMIKMIAPFARVIRRGIAVAAAALVLAQGLIASEFATAQGSRLDAAEMEKYIAFCAGVYLWQTGEASPETQQAISMIMDLRHVDRRTAINMMFDARDERLIDQLQGHEDAADPYFAKTKINNCQNWTGIVMPQGEIRVLPLPWSRPQRTFAEFDKDRVQNCAGMYALQDPDSPFTADAITLAAEVWGITREAAAEAAENKAKAWAELRSTGQAKPVEISNLTRRCAYWTDIPAPEGTPPFGEYPTRTCDDKCEATRNYIAAVHVAAEAGRRVECMDAEVAAAKIMNPYYAQGAEAISRYNNTQVCIGGECYGGGDISLGIETRSAMCKAFNRAIGAIPSQCTAEYLAIREERENLRCR